MYYYIRRTTNFKRKMFVRFLNKFISSFLVTCGKRVRHKNLFRIVLYWTTLKRTFRRIMWLMKISHFLLKDKDFVFHMFFKKVKVNQNSKNKNIKMDIYQACHIAPISTRKFLNVNFHIRIEIILSFRSQFSS